MKKRIWLETLRSDADMTHQQVADSSDIDRAYYTQIENGVRRPSPDVAQRIAATLSFDWTIFFIQNSGESPQSEHCSKSDPNSAA